MKLIVAWLVIALLCVGWGAVWVGVSLTQHNWDFMAIGAVPLIFGAAIWAFDTVTGQW